MADKFELNLERMAMLSKAIALWELPDVNNKIREFFIHEYLDNDVFYSNNRELNEEKWHNITKSVLGQLKLEVNMLPSTLDSELTHVVRSIGTKIYNWHEYLYKHIKYDPEQHDQKSVIHYMEQIYWTSYGTIDELKILKSFWLDNPRVDIAKVYHLACEYMLEENVNNLWAQIPKEVQDKSYEDIYKVHELQILAYWECYRDGDLSQLIRYFERAMGNARQHEAYNLLYNRQHSIEENMFKLSLHQGYSRAVEYFWDKLNEEEKERNIVSSVRASINRYNRYANSYSGNGTHYKQEKYVEICMFLLNQMRAGHKKELFKKEAISSTVDTPYDKDKSTKYKHNILKMLLSVWPWQEFFIEVLEEMWNGLEEDGNTGLEVLSLISSYLKRDHELGYIIEGSRYQQIFRKVWHKIPLNLKAKIAEDNSHLNLICDLLDIWDLSSIKLIVNAPEMVNRREKLIESGYTRYIKLIEEDKYKLLDQFIEEILHSSEEKKSFKKKIDIWDHFIEMHSFAMKIDDKYQEHNCTITQGNRYDLADRLLNWQCSAEEERKELKSSIDHVRLLQRFIEQEQYESANRFLAWCFTSAEEIRNCKNSFKEDEFACRYIYQLWFIKRENIDIAKEKSLNFLSWLLNSEEEIAWFKKEKLIKNSHLMEMLTRAFIFEIMEDFLSWCLLSQEEIQSLKQIVVKKMIWTECYYGLLNDSLDAAEKFVKWAFNEEEKRTEFIKRFILSEDGIGSCSTFIADISQPKPILEEKLVKFIDFWIRPLDNLDELKSRLVDKGKTRNFTYVQIENHKIFMNLLDKLALSHDMTEEHNLKTISKRSLSH